MIPGVMVQDLIGREVEVWVRGGRPDQPTFSGMLLQAIVASTDPINEQERAEAMRCAPLAFLIIRDRRGIEIRVPAGHVTAVVFAHG